MLLFFYNFKINFYTNLQNTDQVQLESLEERTVKTVTVIEYRSWEALNNIIKSSEVTPYYYVNKGKFINYSITKRMRF